MGDLVNTASRIIKKYGQAGSFTRIGPEQRITSPTPEYPNAAPFAPVIIPGGEIIHTCTVAIVDYEQEQKDGMSIQADDLRALVSVEGLTITPTIADVLDIASGSFSVVRVTPLAPDGVARFYDMQVRR